MLVWHDSVADRATDRAADFTAGCPMSLSTGRALAAVACMVVLLAAVLGPGALAGYAATASALRADVSERAGQADRLFHSSGDSIVYTAERLTPLSPLGLPEEKALLRPASHGATLRGAGGEALVLQVVLVFRGHSGEDQPLRDISFSLALPDAEVTEAFAWRAWTIWDIPEVAVPVRLRMDGTTVPSPQSGALAGVFSEKSTGVSPSFQQNVLTDVSPPIATGAFTGSRVTPGGFASVPEFSLPSELPYERDLFTTDRYVLWPCYVEFRLPRGRHGGKSTPEVLEGVLEVRFMQGQAARAVPISLRVELLPYDLPLRPSFVVEMNSYGDWMRLLPPTVETYTDLHRMFRRYGTTFTQVPYRQDGSIPLGFLAPQVSGSLSDDAAPLLAWSDFDAAMAPLLDGSAFTDGQPLSHLLLPLSFDWPVRGGKGAWQSADYTAINQRVRREMLAHVVAQGWKNTRYQEFHNENPEVGSSAPWHLDEPRRASDLRGHALYLAMREAAQRPTGSGGNVAWTYRMDISRWEPLRDDLRTLVPSAEQARLKVDSGKRSAAHAETGAADASDRGRTGGVDDWAVSAAKRFLTAEAISYFRNMQSLSASEGWLTAYGELPGFAHEGRQVPWAAIIAEVARFWSMGLDGYAQWIVDMWKPAAMNGPEYARVLFRANGGGARDFIWPGTLFGVDGAVPSLRLLAVRQAVDIAAQAAMLCPEPPVRADAVRPDADAWCDQLRMRMTALSAYNETDIARIRAAMQEKLSARYPAGHSDATFGDSAEGRMP